MDIEQRQAKHIEYFVKQYRTRKGRNWLPSSLKRRRILLSMKSSRSGLNFGIKLISEGLETNFFGLKKKKKKKSSSSDHDMRLIAIAKVCKDCSEVHVGPSGHKARLCGIFKYQSWRGTHFWRKGDVDDLLPPKIVWFRRPQDPPVPKDESQNYYGHAPAVVDLCTKVGAIAPSKYHCLMKVEGLSAPG